MTPKPSFPDFGDFLTPVTVRGKRFPNPWVVTAPANEISNFYLRELLGLGVAIYTVLPRKISRPKLIF